jgi:hypothetical protein
VAAGRLGRLEDAEVRVGDVADVHVRLHGNRLVHDLTIKCYSNICANNRLIRLNKFVSWFTDGFCNLFFY